jgi:methylmalonyl-CoA mutase N-terminal domain/subunit
VVVGVNRYATDAPAPIELLRLDPETERRQIASVQAVRTTRDRGAWQATIGAIERAASGRDNLVPLVIAAVEARATLGEISDALRRAFGEHRELSV